MERNIAYASRVLSQTEHNLFHNGKGMFRISMSGEKISKYYLGMCHNGDNRPPSVVLVNVEKRLGRTIGKMEFNSAGI